MPKCKPQTKITRRESLVRIAATTYAAPATLALITSTRAIAQSQQEQQCVVTFINNASYSIRNDVGLPDLLPTQQETYDYRDTPIGFVAHPFTTMYSIWRGDVYNQRIAIMRMVLDESFCYEHTVTFVDGFN